jgi:hypothetical protein
MFLSYNVYKKHQGEYVNLLKITLQSKHVENYMRIHKFKLFFESPQQPMIYN